MGSILFLSLAIFFSGLINSTFGFGFALTAVPLLSLILDLKMASPLISLLFITGSTAIIIKEYKKVQIKNVLYLALAATLLVPFGLYLNQYGNQQYLKLGLGLFIIAFSIYNLFAPKLPHLKNDRWAPLFGGISGFLAGICNISGPPVVIYSTLRMWEPAVFRASLQAYFFYINLTVITGHIYHGSYENTIIFTYYMYTAPAMLLAVPVGKKINAAISDPNVFRKYVYLLMLISGIVLLVQSA